MLHNHPSFFAFSLSLCAAITVVSLGCGRRPDGRPARVAFQARISIDGSPVDGAVVVLSPHGDGGAAASGVTDPRGVVIFSTFESNDGVIPGDYAVSIMKTLVPDAPAISPDDPAYDPAKAGRAPKPKDLLPARYKDTTTSGLTLSVDAATETPFEIGLEP